jgi:hypothetical protein
MDLRVTIDTAAADEQRTWASAAGETLRRVHGRGMSRAFVAGLAQKRGANFQHGRLHGAMRLMTIAAVLGDRLMFPEEGSAQLRMAACARFGHGILDERR